MQQTSVYARFKERSGRSSKRPLEDDAKVALSESSAASISATFELHACAQACRSFVRGRCLKSNDVNLPPGDPTRCMEAHDKPKGEVKCCSILVPGDPLYHKNFTTCRAKMVGEECQYICSNEGAGGRQPMVDQGAAAPEPSHHGPGGA